MTLAERILNVLNEEQKRTEADWAQAKAEYEAAHKKYAAAWEATEVENFGEMLAHAEGELHAHESRYQYCTGKKSAAESLSLFLRAIIKIHEKSESVEFFDEATA